MSQAISSRLGKFLYCLENEQWLLPSNYSLFQIHFSTDFLSHSLSHLNIIFSFIIYSFFNNYTSSNIFFIQYLIIIIEKKTFEEWTVAHQTWWATVHEQKKSGYRVHWRMNSSLFCGFRLKSREDFVFSSPVGDALSSATRLWPCLGYNYLIKYEITNSLVHNSNSVSTQIMH